MSCERILAEKMIVMGLDLKDDKAIRDHKQSGNEKDGPLCAPLSGVSGWAKPFEYGVCFAVPPTQHSGS